VPGELRAEAGWSAARGIDCLLDLQLPVGGRRTAWGAQHDPISLAPVGARSYEHASLSGHESASVLLFLMGLEAPGARVVEAVHAGADWLRETALGGLEYRGRELVRRADAPPVWARFYEIGTHRPIFSNRDGVVRYRWEELEAERRNGYAWYSYRPAAALARYAEWAVAHPRAGSP
jgi:PelA/Pel-15E family pectate lyase